MSWDRVPTPSLQLALAQRDDLGQTLGFDGANESLRVSIQIGASDSNPASSGAAIASKRGGVLARYGRQATPASQGASLD